MLEGKDMTKTTKENVSVTTTTKEASELVKENGATPLKVTAKDKATTSTPKKESKAVTKKVAKEEPKKITAKAEAKKLTTKPEPKKIAAKPAPKKIASKEVKQLAVAKESKEKEAVVKKEPKKATVKKVAKPSEKISKEPKKAKTTQKDKQATYMEYSLDTCIANMKLMGVLHEYSDYTQILLDEDDLLKIEKNIMEGNALTKKSYDFDKDGFDTDLIMITLQKVVDSMDIKATEFKEIAQDIADCMLIVYGEDAEKNAVEYLKEFKLCEKILMIGQRKNIATASEVSELINTDVEAFVKHFFAFAYEILPSWQYADVKFYEDFAYAMLSQYEDLFDACQLNLLLDCADLYVKHGDYYHGDEAYQYILRENKIKDYIYYRYAFVYEPIDKNKAKAIAYDALHFVDERFMYYPNIMNVING